MTKKVFISYSHKDEVYKEALDEHLSMLKRNNVIASWNDRKLIPGQNWANEISENLDQADLILFLISSSFLASDYCFNVEAKRAIEMHANGKAQLIPILVRPCDWESCEFSTLQAVPKDAQPISTWDNEDQAWLDAIGGIKKHIAQFKPVSANLVSHVKNDKPQVKNQVLDWINDIEVILTHRKVDKVTLDNVYVALDLAVERQSKSEDIQIVSSDLLFSKASRYLVSGEEQQGKTSLLKNLYKEFLKREVAPLYLDASEIKQSDTKKVLSSAIEKQYLDMSFASFMEISEKVLLIDNLHAIGLNTKFRDKFLSSLNEDFQRIIITCNSSYSYIVPEIFALDEFEKYEILSLGHIKRAEIVEKWVALGVEESIEEKDLFDQCDELKSRLDAIIRKNIVPAKPIYVLMLLQMFEAYSQQNLELSSHGHCYQQLVYQAFDHAGVPKNEIDKYLNVLTELSWVLHKNDGAINQHGLEVFFKEYEKTYLPVDGAIVIQKLKSNSILAEQDFKIQFKYPYLYYFFAAKKIAESFTTNDDVKNEVRKLIANLHREDYANILVFVTHHTKEAWVLSEIKDALDSFFMDQEAATLSRDQLAFMDEFIAKIPNLVLEQREIRAERTKHNKNLDEIEHSDQTEKLGAVDLLATINRTFKGMEISGQIIRNRHATLTRKALLELANQSAMSGLRFLNFFIQISNTAKAEVIKHIETKLQEHPNLTNTEVQHDAKDVFLHITYGVINGVVKKIASSIGSKEASEIYASIEKAAPTPAVILLNQAIELHFKRNLDISSISVTAEKLKGNPICTRILKEMVIQHTYMFPVGYKEKQQLAELLNFSMQGQRLMDLKKIGKA
ncbi:TIR domain-containing protein [Herminiimonas arsenitoxidans]|uniref:TIR domain-containing protein n=1 Tax=Herminiimonas arsenitoxidans TaxID=1809410 RepID=UPI000970A511|nr:TIR domain-containing protein [Herminiimonas arsenitoxidans]